VDFQCHHRFVRINVVRRLAILLTIRNGRISDCAVDLLRRMRAQVLQERANANGKQLGCASIDPLIRRRKSIPRATNSRLG